MQTIPLTQGKVALVDDADFEWLSQWKWFATKWCGLWYAARRVRDLETHRQRTLYMHRAILEAGEHVDHKDGDGLNNQRSNLRPATHAQNMANRKKHSNNTSGFRGVYYNKKDQRWRAQITGVPRRLYLGNFRTPEEAARAYDAAALKHFGEFARLNFGAEK